MNTLFYLLKMFRLAKGFRILNVYDLNKKIKGIYERRAKRIVMDPEIAEDQNEDHNKLNVQLNLFYLLKIFHIVIVIMNFAYLLGMFWLIVMKLVETGTATKGDYENDIDVNTYEPTNDDAFLVHYDKLNTSPGMLSLTMMYFSFTSLATVGFGDYCPRSNLERALGSMILLLGVAVFSYIMGSFINIMNAYIHMNDDYDEDVML